MAKRGIKISEDLIKEIIKFYDECQSSRKTAKKFSVSKTTVLEYVKPRSSERISEEERKKRRVESVQRRRLKIKQMAVEYKGGKCEVCGYNKCNRALQFHHRDPTEKDFGIASKGVCRAWEKVKEELDKCAMVCANCHAEIHDGIIEI